MRTPSLSDTVDTSVNMYFGNSSISASLENVTQIWDPTYEAVWHLNEEQAGTGTANPYQESTSNNRDGDDYVGNTGKGGQIGPGQDFDGSNDVIGLQSGCIISARMAPRNVRGLT